MVKKLFNFFNKEINGLHEAAYLLGFFALLCQLLALVRDRVLAATFGAGHDLDMYYSAFRIPDFIFVMVASLVGISVLVPFIIEKVNISKEESKKFIDNIFSAFFLLLIIISGIVFIFTPYLVPMIFKGFPFKDFPELIFLTRVLLLSPILLGLSNFFGSITQVYKRFVIYSISPMVYNLGIIFGILALQPIFGLRGVVYGVILGALFHLLIQIPFVIKQRLFPKFKVNFDWPEIKKVMILSVPRTFTLGIAQITTIFLIAMATFMKDGSVAVFNFSINMQSVTLSIIGVSYSIAAFPTLARFFAEKQTGKFLTEIITSARHIIFWSIPISVLLIVLRAQVVRTILGSGEFNWDNTRLTAAALALFSISALAQGLILLFVRGYYAMGNTKKPLIIGSISGFLIIIFSYLFVKLFASYPVFQYFIESLFRVGGIEGTSILMLPLGYSLGIFINCILLWACFAREFASFSKSLWGTLFHTFSASVIMGAVSYLGLNIFNSLFNLNTTFGIFMQGFLAGMMGIIAGIIVLKLLKNRELEEIWITLHHKIWKVKPLPADITEI
jgi:putative peptidoglycan lipid II flippase